MIKEDKSLPSNTIDNREGWLRTATASLRPMFAEAGLPLPESIRYSIAFTSSGRAGKSVGETWHSPASADGAYEIMIRADIAEPVEVLTVLTRQLVHAAIPAENGQNRRYKAAAARIGLQGKMRDATPVPILQERLNALAASLPPLPHARLDISWKAIDKPKKQGTRMLKATCQHKDHEDAEPCGYTVRLAGKWKTLGAVCPAHGAMTIQQPEPADNSAENANPTTEPIEDHHAV